MTESGSESLLSERPDEENRRLREENARLRQILAIHGISVPPAPPTLTQAAGTAPSESKEERARKRITLFRSLFRGREDVYARRWENAGGQAGYPIEGAILCWEPYDAIPGLFDEDSQSRAQGCGFMPFACLEINMRSREKTLDARVAELMAFVRDMARSFRACCGAFQIIEAVHERQSSHRKK